ncbi:hypothetical protein LguiB_026969 [Lonicera macranthoides]
MLSQSSSIDRLKLRLLKSKDVESSNIETRLLNWNIPKVSIDKIYDTGIFKLFTSKSVKTIKQTIPIGNSFESFQLLPEPEIARYRSKYKYLHIGLVQVALKPLIVEGLNTSFIIALRDCRHIKFADSLLGIIESSLCNGPVYFNCFPNLSISFSDKNILDVLTLNLQLSGYDMKIGLGPINLTYRIYYKVMNILSPRARLYHCGDKTLLLETNVKSNIAVPRTIMWKDITPPSSWLIETTSPSTPIGNKKAEEDLQFDDGDIIKKFDNNRTTRLSMGSRQSSKTSLERFYTPANTIAETSKHSEFHSPLPLDLYSFSKANNLVFEGIMSTCSKAPSSKATSINLDKNNEDINCEDDDDINQNEDIEDYMGLWLDNVDELKDESLKNKTKGKRSQMADNF